MALGIPNTGASSGQSSFQESLTPLAVSGSRSPPYHLLEDGDEGRPPVTPTTSISEFSASRVPFPGVWPASYSEVVGFLHRSPAPGFPVALRRYQEKMSRSAGRARQRRGSLAQSRSSPNSPNSTRSLPAYHSHRRAQLLPAMSLDDQAAPAVHHQHMGSTYQPDRGLPRIVSGESLSEMAMQLDQQQLTRERLRDNMKSLHSHREEDGHSVVSSSIRSAALMSTYSIDELASVMNLSPEGMEAVTQYLLEVKEVEESGINRSSGLQTFINGCNIMLGIGVMSMPYTLGHLGWSGLLLVLVIGLITWYTALVIGWCADENPSLRSFPDLGYAALGWPGRLTIVFLLYTELLLCLCVFLVLMGTTLDMLLPGYGVPMFIVISALAVLPPSLSRDLTLISYVSIIGLVSISVVVGAVVYTGATAEHARTHILVSVDYLPMSMASVCFLFSGHAVFPSLKANMSNPRQYPAVISCIYVVVFVVIFLVGAFGYWAFGYEAPELVSAGFSSRPVAIATNVMIVFIPLAKFSLTLSPVATGIEELLPMYCRSSVFLEKSSRYFIRFCLVGGCCVTALLMPYLTYIEGLVGAVCSTTIGVLFPILCSWRIRRRSMSCLEWPVSVLCFVVFLGVTVVGTYASVVKLVTAVLDSE